MQPKEDKQTTKQACRRLFDAEDCSSEELRRVAFDLERLREEQKRRWNFDFENETPLPGRYEWEAVPPPPVNGRAGADDNAVSPRQVRITKFMRRTKRKSGPKEEATPPSTPLKRTARGITL